MIIQIFYVVFLLYMWFNTDGFVEYSKVFGLNKIFKINLWEDYREINPKLDYLSYMRLKQSNFFIKLITCKQCLSFWLVLISCFFFKNFFYFPVIYMMSYLIYNLICKLIKY